MFALLLAVQLVSDAPGVHYRQPQLAAADGIVALTFGAGDAVYFSASKDQATSFSTPVKVAESGRLALGRHRGPRIALAGGAIVISAIFAQKGGGADGDLFAWRSTDGGKSWSQGVRINDVAAAAREGLHAMASDGKALVYAAWLDLRSRGTKLYGAYSLDAGATWSGNILVYESPAGNICECCHPSVAIDPAGRVYVMWRNWLGGARDMYLARSGDGGKSFGPAQKLGAGTWPLNACPMDGGGLALDARGDPITVWRRQDAVFLARPGAAERELGKGKDPAVAAGRDGVYALWATAAGLRAQTPGKAEPAPLSGDGEFAHLAGSGPVFAAWESKGAIVVERLR